VVGAVTSEFGTKLLRGEPTAPEEWEQQLREFHARLPGATSALLSARTTVDGQSSYQLLAEKARVVADAANRRIDVLDLACGDGYLIQECLHRLGERINTITGVDMSEDELAAAGSRLQPREVRLYECLAQDLALPDESIDVALCHLAFMLMLPIEPVVQELARVLRSNGIFSAVVVSTSAPAASDGHELAAPRALWTHAAAALRQFWQTEYPRMQTEGRVGDARAMTEAGWRQLFRPELGYARHVEAQEFDILVEEDTPDGIWHFFEESYSVALLDDEMKDELRQRLIDVIVQHRDTHGTFEMAIPQRMFTVRKRTMPKRSTSATG
jgi:ubiquinone/menaquinone biosynthesis C-methylase UbiE